MKRASGKTALVQWFDLNNKALEDWQNMVGWVEDWEVLLVPAVLAGPESAVAMLASMEGAKVTDEGGHAYVCADWLSRFKPDFKDGLLHLRGVIKEKIFDLKIKEGSDAKPV